MSAAVFLDRDGTIVEEGGYLDRIDRLVLFPWSVDAVRILNRAGLPVVIVTNQAGVARGMFTEDVVRDLHDHLAGRFANGGARVDGFYYCPHHPEASVERYRLRCECRKPAPGMLRRAARELGLDLARSYVVGDRWIDVQMGAAAGARGLLVRTGYGASEARQAPQGTVAAAVVETLMDAVGWILRRERSHAA
jgi:D-glycero-D-manno-heptose 1,7-bisphosphate phosphatase